MRNILCYGDSNTWGLDPHTGNRYKKDCRWPGVLGMLLGPEYHIIENGISGRSSLWDNPSIPGLNGREGLIYALQSARPIDLIIIMLGTNDLKYTDANGAVNAQKTLIRLIRAYDIGLNVKQKVFTSYSPKILLISPPEISVNIRSLRHTIEPFLCNGESKKLSLGYATLAKEEGVYFLDASQYVKPSEIDGLHLSAEAHFELGKAVADFVLTIFSEISEDMKHDS